VLVASATPLLALAANGLARVADVLYNLASKDLKAHIINLFQQRDKHRGCYVLLLLLSVFLYETCQGDLSRRLVKGLCGVLDTHQACPN
jgi:hypothetical protein